MNVAGDNEWVSATGGDYVDCSQITLGNFVKLRHSSQIVINRQHTAAVLNNFNNSYLFNCSTLKTSLFIFPG